MRAASRTLRPPANRATTATNRGMALEPVAGSWPPPVGSHTVEVGDPAVPAGWLVPVVPAGWVVSVVLDGN
jgi:hypothetical protein